MSHPPVHAFPWARARAFLWRFHTLRFAQRTLGAVASPTVARRRLFGFDAFLDVSRSNAHRLIYLEGERYIKERHLLARLVRPGMTVVDVGANIGYTMLLFRRLVGPRGRVHCFEPEPRNFAELERNRERNGLDGVHLTRAAVGAAAGEATLRTGLNGVVVDGGEGDLTVPMVRLDDALERPPDLIKIDVEGYEGQVLEGARGVIRKHRPTLFLELHSWMLAPPHTVASIFELLRSYYPEPSVYATLPDHGLARKLLYRYLGADAVSPLPGGPALPAAVEWSRAETLWVVCSRGA